MAFTILEVVAIIVAALVSAPLIVLAVECLAAHLPARRRSVRSSDAARPRIDVLVPAHDEAEGITATVQSILQQLLPGDRLWVIADNCRDTTAEVARRANANVLERFSADQRGKGFAINFGISHLQQNNPPDVLVMVDADCLLGPGAMESLAVRASETGRPVQGAYVMQAPAGAGPQSLVSEAAVTIKNYVRPLGLSRLGLPCLLTGSGIALPWKLVEKTSFCGSSIVEDMQLSVEFLRTRCAPLFEPAALITAPLPAKRDAAASQRRRWEHGHLQVLFSQVPQLLATAVKRLRPDLVVPALDIAVPPLSLVGAIFVMALALVTGVAVATGFWLPAAWLAAIGTVATVAVGLALWRFSQTHVSPLALASIPIYMLRKLTLYASYPFARQTAWNRTSRDLPAAARLDSPTPLPLAALSAERPSGPSAPAFADHQSSNNPRLTTAP
jgi:cellulose synthase/poly-beta-1,6-N-acetylglucosamine synthase-like glycosyltransferase